MPRAPKKAAGSRPWSSRIPSWDSVSTVMTVPPSTDITGVDSRFGHQPHRLVSGVTGR